MSVVIIDICFSEDLLCLNLSCTWSARCDSKLKMRFCCPQLDLTTAGYNAWAQCHTDGIAWEEGRKRFTEKEKIQIKLLCRWLMFKGRPLYRSSQERAYKICVGSVVLVFIVVGIGMKQKICLKCR